MKPLSVRDFDLESYIQKFGAVPVQNNEWSMTCPVCGRADKLMVNTVKKNWHCWICQEYVHDYSGKKRAVKGAGGVLAFIELMEGCTRERAAEIIRSGSTSHGVGAQDLFSADFKVQEDLVIADPPAIPPPFGWRPIYSLLPYCEQRGITMEDVQAFGLVFCDVGRYRNRLVFPVWEGGKLVYYQARAMWSENPGSKYVKSLNPEKHPGGAGPSDVIMNLETARLHPRVALTEGPVDCIHTGPSAVCTFGKRISLTQILKLKRSGVRSIDLMWDGPDEKNPHGAWMDMIKAAGLLSGLFDVRLVFLPWGDPGDYSRAELDQFRSEARPASSISRLAMI